MEDESAIDEYGGKFAKESEIIYRDSNIVAMIPKSQMASKVYGQGTKWCQVGGGFDSWSKQGLLIRFLFKGGRKIRFTYFFDRERSGMDYYWASENGQHLLQGNDNPFDAKPPQNRYKGAIDMEDDILNKITEIPEECKRRVLEFIEQHRTEYKYCYRKKEYSSESAKRKEFEAEVIRNYYEDAGDKVREHNPKASVNFRYSKSKNRFEVSHTHDYMGEIETERFVDSGPALKRYIELLKQYTDMPKKTASVIPGTEIRPLAFMGKEKEMVK